MVSNLDKISSEVIHYGLQSYNKEFKEKRNSVPDEFKKLEEKLGKINEENDFATEKLTEYFELLDSDSLYVDNTFAGFLLSAPRPKLDIPDYQRDFSWETPQHARLWLDLMHFVTNLDKGQLPETFLGSTYVSDESDELQIIDGQQRMTSILLIILNIKRELDILISNNQTSSPFWSYAEYYSGEYFLERMMYNFDEPVLRPNKSDKGYFDAIFLNDPENKIETVEDLEKTEKGGGASIKAETLLKQKLGVPPHKIDELLSISPNQKLLRRSSNSKLMTADQFYRNQIGDLVGVFNGIYEQSIDLEVVSVENSEATVVVTTESDVSNDQIRYPVANADVYLADADGSRTHCGRTGSDGRLSVAINGKEAGRKLIVSSFGEEKEIEAKESSDLHPGPMRVRSTKSDSSLQVILFDDGTRLQDGTVTINGNQHTSNENGVINIDLESTPKNQDEDKAKYVIEPKHVKKEFGFDELDDLSDYVFNLPVEKFESDQQRVSVLLNLTTILLHSLRVVYAEFGQNTDKEYKINVFQSLNDRGMELELSDIIRARIIASEVSNVSDWDRIEDDHDLGDGSRIDEFLNDYLVVEQGMTDAKEDDYKSLFSLSDFSMGDAESLLNTQSLRAAEQNIEELRSYSDRFVEIVDSSIPDKPTDPKAGDPLNGFDTTDPDKDANLRAECETLLSHLNKVGSAWRSLVLAIYKNFSEVNGRGDDFNKILQFINKLVYRYGLYGTDISSTEMDFIDEVTAIYNGHRDDRPVTDELSPEQVRKLVINKMPSSLQWDSIIGQAVRKRGWTNKTVENLLTRYIDITLSEYQNAGYIQSEHGINPDVNLSIEHIFPTSLVMTGQPADKLAWLKHFFEPVDQDTEVGKAIKNLEENSEPPSEAMKSQLQDLFAKDIGNMMPLISEDNSSIQTRLYSKKIVYYFLMNRSDMLRIDEYQAKEKYDLSDIVPLVEEFADKKGYSDKDLTKLLGLLISSDSPSDIDVIHQNIDASIPKSDLEARNPDDKFDKNRDLREAVREMLSQSVLDETDDGAPDIIKEFNKSWNVDEVIDRKAYFLKQVLGTLRFERGSKQTSRSQQKDPYSGLKQMVKDDFEDRYDFESI